MQQEYLFRENANKKSGGVKDLLRGSFFDLCSTADSFSELNKSEQMKGSDGNRKYDCRSLTTFVCMCVYILSLGLVP